MEELINPIYMAKFDPISGTVLSVGPHYAFANDENVLQIENNIAEMIIEGEINIFNCAVDIKNFTFELVERQNIFKIDDILHRLVDSKWSEDADADIYVTFDKSDKTFKIQLTEEFYGTKKVLSTALVKKRKIIWSGETILHFYITKYNDPHLLYSKFDVILKDLVENEVIIKGLNIPEKFSVYTRRVLKKYVMEIL